MSMISKYQAHFESFLRVESNSRLITFFCKSLYVFLFIKIIFLWSVLHEISMYMPYQFKSILGRIIYAPITVAQLNVGLFLILILAILLVSLLVRLNYFTSIFIFWLSFCLSRLTQPVANGSDLVLNLFLFYSIFLATNPSFKTSAGLDTQRIVSNFTLLACQIHVALIYLLSGYDKLISAAWRSGDAVYSIMNLEFFVNPGLSVSLDRKIFIALAWLIILFELCFPFLVWFKRFRIPVLLAGIIFHLSIIFLLSLPDFGIVMILVYSLFLPDMFADRLISAPADKGFPLKNGISNSRGNAQ